MKKLAVLIDADNASYKSIEAIMEEVAKYGAELPKTKEEYRKLVEEQLAAGEEGAKFAAVLLALLLCAGTWGWALWARLWSPVHSG